MTPDTSGNQESTPAARSLPPFMRLDWPLLETAIAANRAARTNPGGSPVQSSGRLQRAGARLRWFFSRPRLVRYFLLKPAAAVIHLTLFLVTFRRCIRIGTLNEKGLVTIMIMYIEPYLRRLRLEHNADPLLIVINPGLDPNPALSAMYKREIWLLDDETPKLRSLFQLLFERIVVPAESALHAPLSGGDGEQTPYWRKCPPVITISEPEKRQGEELLDAMRVPSGSRTICFGVRESSYYAHLRSEKVRRRFDNFEHDDEFMVRNPPIDAYLRVAERLADEGAYLLRMGAHVTDPLPETRHAHIIDYAAEHRTALGDVYLLANCEFVITGAAGFWLMSAAFNRPTVHGDLYALSSRIWRPEDLYIPTLFWYRPEKRFLTFEEVIAGDLRISIRSNLEALDVELVFNTADDLNEVVEEMQQRLRGSWTETEEDRFLQERLNRLYPPGSKGYYMQGKMGAAFLRRHRDLLG